ncbi:DUF3100 domain-containing protein [Paenibacillus sp. Marseille-P2973]|uniref:DUF3100 domain-containing protein n=1 Tax=Paenibacillus sp. Marseille-P2973 TaxID=1871032 RepID=UPI001B38AA10|nr:DUF3100 domain-containing protein [Paenibacillus sp. Marseille-P2973]MBQ4901890.1 DUF3100 domain-containing protein [Paenibacillus sp. Marseille-P2973]
MNELFLTMLSLSLIALISVGCSTKEPNSTNSAETAASPVHQQSEHQPEAESEESQYTLDATAYKENDRYFLNIETNLNISKENYGIKAVEGEGHIHLYINGSLIGPIQETSAYPLPMMKKGTNEIKLVLATNKHAESYKVSKELSIEVEE